MNEVKNLRLSWTKRILLGLGTLLASSCVTLVLFLIQESDAFQPVREAKIIDRLLAMLLPSSVLTIPVLIFALLLVSVFLNFILFKRMRLYYTAAEKFGELFYGTCLRLSKCLGQPVKLQFNNKDLTIDYSTKKTKEK